LITEPTPESGIMERLDLTPYRTVFADSKDVLEQAWRAGLSRDAVVRTSSPALLYSGWPNIVHAENRWEGPQMEEFYQSIPPLLENLHAQAMRSPAIADYAVLIARIASLFHRVVSKAACLSREDLSEPRLVLSIDTGASGEAELINPPWAMLLGKNQRLREVRLPVTDRRSSDPFDTQAGIFARLRLAGVETVLYRLALRFWHRAPRWLARMEVLINSENELVIETAAQLAMRRMALRRIKASAGEAAELSQEEREALTAVIYPAARQAFSRWMLAEIAEECVELFRRELETAMGEQKGAMRGWTEKLAQDKAPMRRLMLTNHTGPPDVVGMVKALQQGGVLTVAMQHGVTPELGALCEGMVPFFENNVTDLLLTFNEEAERIYNRSPFKYGNAISVGAPMRYFRAASLGGDWRTPAPVLYVSTKLYRGNRQILTGFLTDFGKARQEWALVERVLGKLPHRLLFKPYPEENRRYADEDPVVGFARKQENIEVYEKRVDLRYILSAHRVVIASRATSTISWCLLSGKPLVFINYRNEYALSSQALEAFRESVFLFDADDGDFFANLRTFLSQPIDEIERQWRQKEAARSEMIRRFISGDGPGAGRRAADILSQV